MYLYYRMSLRIERKGPDGLEGLASKIIKKQRPTRYKPSSLNKFLSTISQSLGDLKRNTERKGQPNGQAGGKRKTRGKRITGKKTRSNRR